jgi:hypothetical protein
MNYHSLGPEVYEMSAVVRSVLASYQITSFQTLNVGYAAEPVQDLFPTEHELTLFRSGDPLKIAAAIADYWNNVKKYLTSIDEGITSAVGEAEYLHQHCPRALLILAGYSQGAMVMHQAELQLAAAHDTGVLSQIAGTLLLGDGDRVSRTAAREFGTSASRSEGVRSWVEDRLHLNGVKDVVDPATTANICNDGDIVCDFGINTVEHWKTAGDIHGSYTKEDSNGNYTHIDPALINAATWIGGLAAHRLHGGLWTATEAPVPGDADGSFSTLNSVACPSAIVCVTVGYYADTVGNAQGLLLAGSGTSWTATQAPVPANAAAGSGGIPSPVACASATTCVTAGYYADTSGNLQGLLLTKSGTTWTAAQAPVPVGADAHPRVSIGSVACPSATACVAVGNYYDSSGTQQGLLLTGFGAAWTATQAPLPTTAGANGADLFSVACPSATACVAVGEYSDSGGEQGLLLTGSGTTWTPTQAPKPGNANNVNPGVVLSSVACPSTSTCVAGGSYSDFPQATSAGLLLTRTGTTWVAAQAPVPVGAPANSNVSVLSVACPSTATCVASGYYDDSAGGQLGLLLAGSGTTWAPAEAPLPPDARANPEVAIGSVACASTTTCIVVGSYADSSGQARGLLLNGSGTTWAAAEAPKPASPGPADGVSLNSVACTSTTACVAVGEYTGPSGNQQGLLLTGPD